MLQPDDSFGRYRVEAQIGSGGMGAVYRARDTLLDRRVALKIISSHVGERPDATARLTREARAAAAFEHPNVVTVFDIGEHEGVPFIAMEFVVGRTLRQIIDAGPDSGVDLATRTTMLVDIARALHAAHRRGLVHRDIKPENVIVSDEGVVKVLDFGIARLADRHDAVDGGSATQLPAAALPSLTTEGVPLGTPYYMAPEQIQCEPLDGRVDQFAWGVLAYELLSGELPWSGGSLIELLAAMLTMAAPREALERAGVPERTITVILRALSREPGDRFDSMFSVVEALPYERPRSTIEGGERSKMPLRAARGPVLPPRPSPFEPTGILESAPSPPPRLEGRTLEPVAIAVREPASLVASESRGMVASESLARASADELGLDLYASDPGGIALELRARRRFVQGRRRTFYRHAGIFAVIAGSLQLLGSTLAILPWTVFPALAWAMALGVHGVIALSTTERDWRPKAIGPGSRDSNARERRRRRREQRAGRSDAAD